MNVSYELALEAEGMEIKIYMYGLGTNGATTL